MALLNWGNALSQAGKTMATVGLEGVKSTLERDKIRLAADLAAKNEEASDARRAKAALELTNRQGELAATAAERLVKVDEDKIQAARDFTATLADPNNKAAKAYLAGTEALMNADPAKRGQIQASRDASALSIFQLKAATDLSTAQKELARAVTPEARQIAEQKVRGLTATSESLNQTGSLAGSAARLDEAVLNASLLARGRLTSELTDARGLGKANVQKLIQGQINALDRTIVTQTETLALSNAFAKSQIPGYPAPAPADDWVTGPDGVKIRKQQ